MHLKDYVKSFPRGKRGKEISRLSKACDVNPTSIYFWMNGKRHVGLGRMSRLEKATKRQVTRIDMWADI